MSKVKTPDPREKSTLTYFDNTDDGGIRCVAAAMSMASDCHIIICAPDIVALKKAWANISDAPLDVKKSQVLLYKYEPQLEEFKKELKTKVSEVTHTEDAKKWYWYYYPHSKHPECFIEESCFVCDSKEIRLGGAKDCSISECKALLRENKIPRSIIDTINIDASVDHIIPF